MRFEPPTFRLRANLLNHQATSYCSSADETLDILRDFNLVLQELQD